MICHSCAQSAALADGQLIWRNLQASADWCLQQPPRTEWIPTAADDPQYENLYDRFYAAMHDLAIVETLAFASALSDPASDPYFAHARAWLLAAARFGGTKLRTRPTPAKPTLCCGSPRESRSATILLFDRLTPD